MLQVATSIFGRVICASTVYGETSTSIHREIEVLKTKAWRSSIQRCSVSLAVYAKEVRQ